MGDIPQQENKPVSFVNSIIAAIVGGAGSAVVSQIIETAVPILRFPIIKQIFEAVVSHFMGLISVNFQGGAAQIIINIETNSELHGVVQAAEAKKQALATGDQHAIDEANQNLAHYWDNLGHWDGSSKPH